MKAKKFQKLFTSCLIVLLFAVLSVSNITGEETLPAFPGAEGFGSAATGGRGGRVIHVTTLEDYMPYTSNGPPAEEPIPGSLRWALKEETGPRIIVFDVGGILRVKTGIKIPYQDKDITIAGQTAPNGITIMGGGFIANTAENFIIRHIRVRGGAHTNAKGDGMSLHGQNFIIDHVSTEGSADECVDMCGSTNHTFQWSTIEESTNWGQGGNEHGEGSHNKGMIAASYNPDAQVTVHHTLIANHGAERHPVIRTTVGADCRNNVATGLSTFSTRTEWLGLGLPHYNVVNNCWVRTGIPGRTTLIAATGSIYPLGLEGNLWFREPNQPPETEIRIVPQYTEYHFVDEPFAAPPVTTEPAYDPSPEIDSAYESVLAYAGAWPRDATSRRTIKEVKEMSAGEIIGEKGLRGPYEHFPEKPGPTSEAFDTDRDGMPDDWENTHGLNPNDPEDRNNIVSASASQRHAGYTYVEYYLNELADAIVGVSGTTYIIEADASPEGAGSAMPEHGLYEQERYFYSLPSGNNNGGYNIPYWYGLVPFGRAEFNEGSLVMMKARPKPGYKFSHWSGGPVEGLTSTQISFPATEDITITANFVPVTGYSIDVSIAPENSGNVAGIGSYEEGDIVTLAAYSDNGYKFKRWLGGPVDGAESPTVQFSASQDYQITAEFETGSGGDFLIDDFNDQDANSYLLGADGQPKKWNTANFYEIAPGNYGLNNVNSGGNGGIDFANRDYQVANKEAEIPAGSTVLKFRVYNFGDQEAHIDESERTVYQGSPWNRIDFHLEREGTVWGPNYRSPQIRMFYGKPLKFPTIEPNGSAVVELPLKLIRARHLTRRLDLTLDKLEGFSLRGIAGRNMWGYTRWDDAKIIIDDIAFGRSGVDEATLPNLSPQANAGRDQTTRDCDGDGKETVLLNGLKSCDGDAGLITGWSWKESDTEIATGFAPSVELGVGAHEIMLSVTDEDGATSSDTVTITVLEQGEVPPPPVLPGDVNGDGRVDIRDLLIVARAFGSVPGDASWDERADLHENGVINIRDLLIVARNFGRNL